MYFQIIAHLFVIFHKHKKIIFLRCNKKFPNTMKTQLDPNCSPQEYEDLFFKTSRNKYTAHSIKLSFPTNRTGRAGAEVLCM